MTSEEKFDLLDMGYCMYFCGAHRDEKFSKEVLRSQKGREGRGMDGKKQEKKRRNMHL